MSKATPANDQDWERDYLMRPLEDIHVEREREGTMTFRWRPDDEKMPPVEFELTSEEALWLAGRLTHLAREMIVDEIIGYRPEFLIEGSILAMAMKENEKKA